MNIRFPSPFSSVPHPLARAAAERVMDEVCEYMTARPESELHTRGKMFGVLVVAPNEEGVSYLKAFSAMLDGTYYHDGFVPPVFEIHADQIVGKSPDDSREKQRWLFSQFRFHNALGEQRDLLSLFADVPPILSRDEFFNNESVGSQRRSGLTFPPSGAGECCAPKLLEEAYRRGLHPICMAEFWMGAPPKDELRLERHFYPACSGKCRPILRHMLQGLDVEDEPSLVLARTLSQSTRVVYEDPYMLIVSKPSGLLSVPGKDGQFTLIDYLHERYGADSYLQAAHRLDQDTSGLLVVARTEDVYKAMQRMFFEHKVEKMYVAEIEDTHSCAVSAAAGVIELPLLANPLDRPRQMVDWQHGKRAVTRWQIEEVGGAQGVRRVRLYPETGRTHQLRVHCAHPDGLASPIVGDRLYGFANGETPLHLHATRLLFVHPVTGERIDCAHYPDWWEN